MREIKKTARNAYTLGNDVDTAQFRTSNNEIIDVKVSSGRVTAFCKGKELKLSGGLSNITTIQDFINSGRRGSFSIHDDILSLLESRRGSHKGHGGRGSIFGEDCSSDGGSGCEGGFSCGNDGDACTSDGDTGCASDGCNSNVCSGNTGSCTKYGCGGDACSSFAGPCALEGCGGHACAADGAACAADGCGGHACAADIGPCGADGCGGQACAADGAPCAEDTCGANACAADGGISGGGGCHAEGCSLNTGLCGLDSCAADACAADMSSCGVNACVVNACGGDVLPCALKIKIKPSGEDGTTGGNSGPSLPGSGGDDDGGDSCATDLGKATCPVLNPGRESRRPGGICRNPGIRRQSTTRRLSGKRKPTGTLQNDKDKSDE